MRIIVYGAGNNYKKYREFLANNFTVVAVCDERYIQLPGCVSPCDIGKYEYDRVVVTSDVYYAEIYEKLVDEMKIAAEKVIPISAFLGTYSINEDTRHKWVVSKLKEVTPGSVLLDTGAGEARYKKYCANLKYIAQDFGEYNPKMNNMGLHPSEWDYSSIDIQSDITNIPLESNSIDVILCTEVLEHIANPTDAFAEFSRLLKSGGKLILTAPFCCMTHMAPYFFYNGFSDDWYRTYLEKCGFAIQEMTYNGNYFEYILQEVWRMENMVERYVGSELDEKQYNTIQQMKFYLKKWSEKDFESSTTMRFGTFIVAEKR